MAIRTGEAVWRGDLTGGEGRLKYGRKPVEQPYSFTSRFEDGTGTNPEELIAAAHAACFSMALSHALSEAGHPPEQVRTVAKVHLEKTKTGFSIPRIELQTTAEVPGIEERDFQQRAKEAKENCPVSRLLAGAKISLDAKLAEPSPLGTA
ncbi:MAG: peroxiredoxin [Planctomycetes bacterium RBG_16_64_10]|nr:MAG: peroxiredoxin [Planctomycetes bacterium RBG_16_64_10]